MEWLSNYFWAAKKATGGESTHLSGNPPLALGIGHDVGVEVSVTVYTDACAVIGQDITVAVLGPRGTRLFDRVVEVLWCGCPVSAG